MTQIKAVQHHEYMVTGKPETWWSITNEADSIS